MDHLGTVSITQFFTEGERVLSLLEQFSSSYADEPGLQEALHNFRSLFTSFSKLQPLVAATPNVRHEINSILKSCMLTFSKIEGEINRLKSRRKPRFWDRIRREPATVPFAYYLGSVASNINVMMVLKSLLPSSNLSEPRTTNYRVFYGDLFGVFHNAPDKGSGGRDSLQDLMRGISENAHLNSIIITDPSDPILMTPGPSLSFRGPYSGNFNISTLSTQSLDLPEDRRPLESNASTVSLPASINDISWVGSEGVSFLHDQGPGMDLGEGVNGSASNRAVQPLIGGMEDLSVQQGSCGSETQSADRYELQVRFEGADDVIHTTYEPDPIMSGNMIEIKKRWTWRKNIGCGTFGTVYLEESESGETRAVKMLTRNPKKIDYPHELSLLMKVSDYKAKHQDLFVQCLGWYQNRTSIFIAMEYMEHGDLSQYLGETDTIHNAKAITRQLLRGLAVLHERNICHRDIKPQNILVASTNPIHVKIADFGISKDEENTFLRTSCGTSRYLAPEVTDYLRAFMPKEFLRKGLVYTKSVDIWAIGFVLYEIFTCKTPFISSVSDNFGDESGVVDGLPPQDIDFTLLADFCAGKEEFPVDVLRRCGAEDGAIELIKGLVVANPNGRMSAKDALKSPWLL